ncbi:MAG: DUF547 domain-containing protein [Nitrospinaceae bacterium]
MIRRRMLAGGFSILFWVAGVMPGWSYDFTAWDALLKKYVRPTTLAGVRLNGVDYPSLAKDPRYGLVVSGLENFSAASLQTREEKLAFWINVYNVLAVKMVLDNYPLDSIKDAGGVFTSVWKKKAGVVGGRSVTLNEIEHEILRQMGDPRIHAAIVCASVSCPDLRREAYTPQTLDRQLDDQLRRFLQNPGKGLRVEGATLYLSSIFKWFAEDFEAQGGVRKFLARYAPGLAKQRLAAGDLELAYLDYNWDLNKI